MSPHLLSTRRVPKANYSPILVGVLTLCVHVSLPACFADTGLLRAAPMTTMQGVSHAQALEAALRASAVTLRQPIFAVACPDHRRVGIVVVSLAVGTFYQAECPGFETVADGSPQRIAARLGTLGRGGSHPELVEFVAGSRLIVTDVNFSERWIRLGLQESGPRRTTSSLTLRLTANFEEAWASGEIFQLIDDFLEVDSPAYRNLRT